MAVEMAMGGDHPVRECRYCHIFVWKNSLLQSLIFIIVYDVRERKLGS